VGAFQISLRCISTSHMGPRLGEGLAQHTRPTGYIEHATARSDTGKGEKMPCQMFAPTTNESLINVGIRPIVSELRGFHGLPFPSMEDGP
jgi:hypothetical protein